MEKLIEKAKEKKGEKWLKKTFKKAKEFIKGEKLDELLEQFEDKLKVIPDIVENLSYIPTYISIIKSCIKKEYTKFPLSGLIVVVGALLYVIYPKDLIPDNIKDFGYVDDALVFAASLKLVKDDVDDYKEWKKNNQ